MPLLEFWILQLPQPSRQKLDVAPFEIHQATLNLNQAQKKHQIQFVVNLQRDPSAHRSWRAGQSWYVEALAHQESNLMSKTNSVILKSILELSGSQYRVASVGEQQRFARAARAAQRAGLIPHTEDHISQAGTKHVYLSSDLQKNDMASLQQTEKADKKHLLQQT